MRRVIALLLLAVLIICSSASVAAANTDEITVTVNSEIFCFGESQLIIRNERILVPLQCGIFEKYKATAEYDNIYKEIIIRTDTNLLTLYMDQLIIYNKGEKCYELDVAPEYKDGQVYVPLRAFMEALGKTVEYDGKTNTAKISQSGLGM